MSAAREHLLGRLEAIGTILSSPVSTDASPVPQANSPAVVVRNGAMVMLFCALEGFVRDRSLECARAINQTTVPYTHLPAALKAASLVSTFEGLVNLSRQMPFADRLTAFERASIAAASGALGSQYNFTEYSFARDKSNVTAEDISKIAKGFGVDNFWNAARIICVKIGAAIVGNVDEIFKQLALDRHRAAHVPSYSVPHSRLTSALPEALALALTFDALISAATVRLSESRIATGIPPTALTAGDVDFMTVQPHQPGRWAAFGPRGSRALFIETSEVAALSRATVVATSRRLSIVCKDNTGRASDWKTVLG